MASDAESRERASGMRMKTERPATEDQAFAAFAARVRADVERELRACVEDARARGAAAGARAGEVIGALGELATRGGKRLRAVLLAAAYEACGGEGGSLRVAGACVALELLQAYLLIHDDWMDQDEVRRGGPSVHAKLRGAFGDARLGDASAVLAGDYGSGLAQRALLSVDVSPRNLLEAARVFARIQESVVTGQLLDLLEPSSDVEEKHDLKTGSYTARGPLAMGAALAGATDEQREALDRCGRPLGIAFQLRDDLLGLFGDAKATGKPSGSDLREGKRTAIVAAAEKDREASRLLSRVLGVADSPDDEVLALMARIVACGAKAQVEARIDALLAEARSALEGAKIREEGRVVLFGAVKALGSRES